jgi:hypothetical protein
MHRNVGKKPHSTQETVMTDLEADVRHLTDNALSALATNAADIKMRLRRGEEVAQEEIQALSALVATALGAFQLRSIVESYEGVNS